MRFAVPIDTVILWLVGLPLLAAVVLAVARVRQRRAALRAFAEPGLLAGIAPGASVERLRLKSAFIAAAVVLLGLAAARPQVGTKVGVARRQGVDLMIAIDVSASMEARDLVPSRFEKARREAQSIVNLLDGDRVGIIVFSGAAFVQCPLTVDYGAASMLLASAFPDMLPTPGTAIGDAVRKATASLAAYPERSKVLVLMTDGEDHGSDPLAAAKEAAAVGVRIYAIGFGSTAGEPIPLAAERGAGHRKDKTGQVVLSRLDEETLVRVAEATGGRYLRATDGEREIDVVAEEISKMQAGEIESRMLAHYEERFQFPLGLALGALLLEALLPDRVRRKNGAA
ncbi:MAG: VWA domain-containing protein [Candidatus Eisenbacteria bacterium]|nr:VWA domain-containing protein [Candidatus Eisenbacteria bacterium]